MNKPTVEICLSPELLHLHQLTGKTVVVADVLRATSCIVAGLASGIASITPVATLEEGRQLMAKGYIGAGERDGKQVEGFHIGNSPFSYMSPQLSGKKVVTTTTNGTQAIQKSRAAAQIIIGAFLNLSAVALYLKKQRCDAVIVCAGWKGKINLEDTLFAGALVRKLEGIFQWEDDAVLAAGELYANMQMDLHAHISRSSHYQRLAKLGIKEDIRFCLEIDRFSIVPIVVGEEIVVSQN
ncbi:MAG: 2-phosphosulfolactate phosphatase [Cytophagales bacterium]|nr:2-phosphosulfolactate phosphatase [Bernardetiaceae bacterium]MDW8205585.1 2-phosphosulfolactate phosphatase [Cytophagales bacterium]